jgi:CheY-like chemotaxis protein
MEIVLSCWETPAAVKGPETSAGATHKPLRVLVVDDNADIARLISDLLELSDHHTRIVQNGVEVLEAAKSFLPDVILLDIGLPGRNGYEVAKLVRLDSLFNDTLLFAVTGWVDDCDKRAAAEAGFDFHLSKPMNIDALLEALSRVSAGR